MAYLRLFHSRLPEPTPDARCLEAYDRELDYLFGTLQRLGARASEVEDLAQEVFMVLHRNWPTFDESRPVRPYLFAIAFRVVSAHRRRRAREVPYAGRDPADVGVSPEGLVANRQSIALLMAALERVPLPRRAVLVMHELDGVPIDDVARKLSISLFGAYARLRKAKRELATAVGRLLKEGTLR